CDEVVRVAQILRDFEASVAFILGGTGDAQVDRVGNQFDVPQFLRGDVGDQIVVGLQFFALAEVEGLVHVVHQGGHFTEAAPQKLLNRRAGVGVGFLRLGQLHLQTVDS